MRKWSADAGEHLRVVVVDVALTRTADVPQRADAFLAQMGCAKGEPCMTKFAARSRALPGKRGFHTAAEVGAYMRERGPYLSPLEAPLHEYVDGKMGYTSFGDFLRVVGRGERAFVLFSGARSGSALCRLYERAIFDPWRLSFAADVAFFKVDVSEAYLHPDGSTTEARRQLEFLASVGCEGGVTVGLDRLPMFVGPQQCAALVGDKDCVNARGGLLTSDGLTALLRSEGCSKPRVLPKDCAGPVCTSWEALTCDCSRLNCVTSATRCRRHPTTLCPREGVCGFSYQVARGRGFVPPGGGAVLTLAELERAMLAPSAVWGVFVSDGSEASRKTERDLLALAHAMEGTYDVVVLMLLKDAPPERHVAHPHFHTAEYHSRYARLCETFEQTYGAGRGAPALVLFRGERRVLADSDAYAAVDFVHGVGAGAHNCATMCGMRTLKWRRACALRACATHDCVEKARCAREVQREEDDCRASCDQGMCVLGCAGCEKECPRGEAEAASTQCLLCRKRRDECTADCAGDECVARARGRHEETTRAASRWRARRASARGARRVAWPRPACATRSARPTAAGRGATPSWWRRSRCATRRSAAATARRARTAPRATPAPPRGT